MGRIERRKRETWLQFLWAAGDTLAVVGSFALAYWLRFQSPLISLIPVTKSVPPVEPYILAGCVITAAWLPLFRSLGLYRVDGVRGANRLWRLLKAAAIAVAIGAALTFFYRGFSFSRAFFPLLFGCLFVGLVANRAAVRVLLRRWRDRTPLRMAVVGTSASGDELVRHHLGLDPAGVELVGRIELDEPGSMPAADVRLDLPRLGSVSSVHTLVVEQGIDVLILALPLAREAEAVQVVEACRGLAVDIEFVPDTFQLLTRRAGVREVGGLPVLSLREFPLTGWNVVRKRVFDLAVAGVGLVVLAPVMALLAVLVKFTSPGPVLYNQERIGRDGRRFSILKFRTMPVDAEAKTGPIWASSGDARPTPIGRVLRQWSLDEIPQLWNVLRGDMSLVGPRPERPVFVDQFSREMPDYLDRHRVKSGITGWAQVNGLRGDTSIDDRTRFDLFYVENWSIGFDIKILWKTIRTVLSREAAV